MTKHVVVVDYDENWSIIFQEMKDYFLANINIPNLQIEHLGSTSVKGLSAKPIIDLAIIVHNEEEFGLIKSALAGLGYTHQGDLGVPKRETFKPVGQTRFPNHHLYVAYEGSLGLRNMLTVRNHLRTHPDDVQKYGELKKRLALSFPYDIDSYIDGKTELLISILSQYDFTDQEIQEIVGINKL